MFSDFVVDSVLDFASDLDCIGAESFDLIDLAVLPEGTALVYVDSSAFI